MLLLQRLTGTAFTLVLSMAGLQAQIFECDGRFFISLHSSENLSTKAGTDIFKVDFSQGAVAFNDIAVFSDIKINGLGYNRQDNFIYGIHQSRNADGVFPIVRLYSDGTYKTLDLDESIDALDWFYPAADCSPDGYFVVHDRKTQQLHYLDVSEDVVTLQASIPLKWGPDNEGEEFYVAMDDFAFGSDDIIYTYQRNYDKDTRESEKYKGAILKIDGDLASPTVGTVTVVGFIDPATVVHVGSMFFKSSDQLYGYGSLTPAIPNPPGLNNNRLISIDKTTGEATLVGEGPNAWGNDGCSCPFTMGVQMQVRLPLDPCQNTLTYDITINNNSFELVSGVTFTDTLPEGMIIQNISASEGLSYQIGDDTGVGYNVITLNNLLLPPQKETSLTLQVSHSGINGTYQHQAYLANLPVALGSSISSDDPTTPVPFDPTSVTIDQEIPPLGLIQDTTVCSESILTLTTEEIITLPFYWTGPNDFYSSDDQLEVSLPPEYDSAYYYLHRQTEDCEIIDSTLVRVSPLPTTKLVSDTTIAPGSSIELSPNSVASPQITYSWTPAQGLSCADCINPIATPTETTTYQLLVQNELGCSETKSVTIEVAYDQPAAKRVSIPNAFSPNGDGINDIFFPVASSDVECQKLEIYNRWGELIFQQTNFPPNNEEYGWPGTYRGTALSSGIYTYRLIAQDEENQQQTYQGKIQLIR